MMRTPVSRIPSLWKWTVEFECEPLPRHLYNDYISTPILKANELQFIYDSPFSSIKLIGEAHLLH